MSRKLKVIPFDSTDLTQQGRATGQEPLEVIPPVSWELNTATNVLHEQGVLGNVVTHSLPFQERTYSFSWVGTRKEINRILNVFTKSSHRHFLLGNISDQSVMTPGIMFNSKGMLASVVEKFKFPGESYRDYLQVFNGVGLNVGSMGMKVEDRTSNFTHIDTSGSAEAFLYIPKNVEYVMSLNPVRYSTIAADQNNLGFQATYYKLDNNAPREPTTEIILLYRDSDTHTITSDSVDRVLRLSLVLPTRTNTSQAIRGVLNYIPPIIRHPGVTPDLSEYEDIPSLLRPVDDYVYNIISPSVAELSMNFKEVSHVSE